MLIYFIVLARKPYPKPFTFTKVICKLILGAKSWQRSGYNDTSFTMVMMVIGIEFCAVIGLSRYFTSTSLRMALFYRTVYCVIIIGMRIT